MPLGFESADALKAYVTCLLLGISLLFAYNALLSTPAYFKDYYKFAQNDPEGTTDNPNFWKNVVSTISLVCNIPNLVVQAGLLHPISRRMKQHTKLLIGLVLMAATLIMIPLVTVFKVGDSGSAAYLMSFIVICAMGTGLYQSTALALVAGFPPKFVGVCIVGIGISGVISNIIGIITQAAMPDTYDGHNNQSKVFYGISGGVIAVTLVALSFFKYNPYAQQYVPEYRVHAKALVEDDTDDTDADEASRLVGGGADGGARLNSDETSNKKSSDALSAADTCSMHTDVNVPANNNNNDDTNTNASLAVVGGEEDGDNTSSVEVFKQTWPMQVSVFVTFTITLFIMPGLAVAVDPEAVWYPILVITMFNVTDTVGRYLPNIKALWMPRKALLIFSLARSLLIPLWFLSYQTKVIEGYTYPMILMGITGITNGYSGCLAMIYAPISDGVETETQKNVSGNIVSFMLLVGCSLGSVLGWAVTTYS